MNIVNHLPRSSFITLPVMLLAVLTACGGGSQTDVPIGGAADCLDARPTAESDAGVVAVAVDGMDPAHRDQQAAAFRTVLRAGSGMQSRLLVSGLRPQSRLVDVHLVGEGENQLFREQDLACKQDGATTVFAEMANAEPTGPRDLFGGLRAIASHLSGLDAGDSVDVLLLTSMVNGTPPLDMTDAGVLSQGAEAMLTTASQASLFPNCSGWRVHAIGPSDVGSDLATDTILREFWSGFFQRCGGELVVFDSNLVTFPASGNRSVIFKPAVGGKTTAALPADLLFSSGSADLSPKAMVALNEVLGEIQRSRPCEILFEGHSDNTPHTSNQVLSEERAVSVRDWMVAHQVDAELITTHGHGDTRPVASNADAVGREKNRRVEVTLTTSC